jgi:hypothetical protein
VARDQHEMHRRSKREHWHETGLGDLTDGKSPAAAPCRLRPFLRPCLRQYPAPTWGISNGSSPGAHDMYCPCTVLLDNHEGSGQEDHGSTGRRTKATSFCLTEADVDQLRAFGQVYACADRAAPAGASRGETHPGHGPEELSRGPDRVPLPDLGYVDGSRSRLIEKLERCLLISGLGRGLRRLSVGPLPMCTGPSLLPAAHMRCD